MTVDGNDATDPASAWGFSTRAIHAGQDPEPITGAVTVPVFQTSTFAQEAVGKHSGYEYARTGNPTRTALQNALASLEGAAFGVSFASGLAAEDAILRLLVPGDHIVMGNDAYGGTFRLIAKVFGRLGITWSAHDLTDPSELDRNWPDNTKLVWVETPTNPLLTVVDIGAVASVVAGRPEARLVVDNTFATPYLQQPLANGADIVRITCNDVEAAQTWAGIPTWSAASWPPTTSRSTSTWPSCRTRSAPSPDRGTAI